jgi:peptidoglycan L-alanyl-D-glutamate endopeptidase CwlK
MSDRNVDDLSDAMRPKCLAWIQGMKDAGISFIITCTRRISGEQAALYAQGRTTPGPIVTWTLNSKHLTGDAFDFVILFCGKCDWQMYHRESWDKAVEIGKSLGMSQVIGKNGKIKEFAHLQLT